MKYQMMMILLAGFLAYAKAAAITANTVPVFAAVKDGTASLPAELTTGDRIKFTCSTDADAVTEAKFYRGATLLPGGPPAQTATATGTSYSKDFTYTTVAADEGDSVYKCVLAGTNVDASKDSNTKSVKISAPTTTAAPTTTKAGGSGSGSGAGSNSPVMAVFLLTIAAMCF